MTYTLLTALLLVSLLSTAEAAAGDANQACDANGACTTSYACDTNRAASLCKAKATITCLVDDDCVGGSLCTGTGSKVCGSCQLTLSTTATDLCTPKPGYLGGTCGTCTAANTECSSSTSKCVCKNGYSAVYSTYSCLASLGTTCSVDADCADTTNNLCDPNAKVCRIRPAKSCANNADKCMTGASCTSGTSVCDCVAATHSADSGVCKPIYGTTCYPTSSVTCKDTNNYCDPYSNTCKIGSSKTCISGETKCTTGATCASANSAYTCTCDTGSTVAETSNFFCQKKIANAAACSWYDTCTDTDSVCDRQLGVCAKKVGSTCTSSDTCVTGATCSSATSKCACTTTGFTENSGLCAAASGKPGGTCSSGACTDTNAECKATPVYGSPGTSACYCKTNFKINPTDGTCITTVKSAATTISNVTAFIAMMAAFCLSFHM